MFLADETGVVGFEGWRGAASWQLCSHATFFVQGCAGVITGSLKASGPDACIVIGEQGEMFGS